MSARARLALFAALATALTSTSLAAVYVDHGWVWPTLGGIVAVLIGAEVGTRVGNHLLLPTLWRVIGALAGLTTFACARYASAESWRGIVPTPAAISRLRQLTDQAFSDIHSLAAPVPGHTGLVLVTSVGVGLVAIVVDLLTVRAALTGLPLLALYSVPEWLAPHGTGPLPFLLGAAGYLVLLLREGHDRTLRWGRAIDAPRGGPFPELVPEASPAGALNQTGRRIGFAALGVALVLPPLVPTLDHTHLFGFGSGNGPGGGGAVVTYNPITKIYGYLHEGSPTPQLRYVVTGRSAGTYLQWTTLDRFSDGGWSQSDLSGAGHANSNLPPPRLVRDAVRATPYAMRVAIDDSLDLKWLPVPEDTTSVADISDQWVYDGQSRTIFSPHSNTRGLTYRVGAVDAAPSTATLLASVLLPKAAAPDDVKPYYDLPAKVSPAVLRKAQQLTARYPTPYQKALALQDYFTTSGGFVYDTDAGSGDGTDLLARFVLESKRGFCEQFASAMAVMARMVGIPARVAVGFTPGRPDGNPHEYVVTSADAHAWPELYFDGIGWLRFEPTPRSDGQAAAPAYAQQSPDVSQAQPGDHAHPDTPQSAGGGAGHPHRIPTNIDNSDLFGHHATQPLVVRHHTSLSDRTLALIALAGALLLALVALPLGRAAGRRRRHAHAHDPAARAHAAWRDLLVDAADLGLRVQASDSPRAAARRLAGLAHLAAAPAAALDRLARAEERARYARTYTDAADLDADARLVAAHFRAAVPRPARLRARLLPPSAVQGTVDALASWSGAVSGWAEAAGDRAAALVRRPLRRGV